MGHANVSRIVQQVAKLAETERAALHGDQTLLEQFAKFGDEEAFARLVRRHGPMTLGVCRRVLRHEQDAEDACQATFLLLALKPRSIRKAASVSSWLHGVALRMATNLKRSSLRRQRHEARGAEGRCAVASDPSWSDVRAILDEEIRLLPALLQAPIVLCYLEGRTRDEAALALGCSNGTVRGRLERGRELLRDRLAGRQLGLPAALLAAVLETHKADGSLPDALRCKILQAGQVIAAGGALSPPLVPHHVLNLMKGMVRHVNALRVTFAALVGTSVFGVIVSVLTVNGLLAQQPGDQAVTQQPAWPAQERAREAGGGGHAERPAPSNLTKIMVGIHNYAENHGHLPPPALYVDKVVVQRGGLRNAGAGGVGSSSLSTPGSGVGGDGSAAGGASLGSGAGAPEGAEGPRQARGKALLSWRVAILPFIEQEQLYRRFRLDEPWDSPHNKALLASMPKVFATPGASADPPFTTRYKVFVGPRAGFEKHRALTFADFVDGTSNTLLVVEAGAPVPWTKPEDIHFDPDVPVPELNGIVPGTFNVALADGSVSTFSTSCDPELLRRAIMRDDGELVDVQELRPAAGRAADLRQLNEQVQRQLETERAHVDALRQQKERLQAAPETEEARRLRAENDRLERLLRQAKQEADQLQEEIRRLKDGAGKRRE